jgi:predicted small metal-binding protein
MKTIACREVGVANCDHVVEGETEDEVMKRGAEHGKNVHGMKDEDYTPEFMQKVRGLSYFLKILLVYLCKQF